MISTCLTCFERLPASNLGAARRAEDAHCAMTGHRGFLSEAKVSIAKKA